MRAFHNPHFQCDGIAFDFRLDRDELEEQVALVHIEVGHGIVILHRAFVEECLVVDIAFFHSEDVVEHRRRVDCVASPCDVGDEILLTFFHFDEHVDIFLVIACHAVFQDFGVAVA